MATAKSWILRIVGGFAGLLVCVLAVVYIVSSVKLNKTYHFREYAITLPTDSASLAHGEHLARLSCFGCHGDSLRGKVFFDQPGVARLVAPNVVERLANVSDAEFAGFMRYAVRKDGTSPFVMPPSGFYHLSDADLGALIAFLRHQPKAASPALLSNSFGPLGRLGIAMGQFLPSTAYFDTTVARVGADPAHATTRKGEYLARMICADCHEAALTGDPQSKSPALAGAVGYSLAEFTTLIREGKPRGDTKLTLMAEMAKEVLHNLSDDEIAAIHGFLRTLPPSGVKLK